MQLFISASAKKNNPRSEMIDTIAGFMVIHLNHKTKLFYIIKIFKLKIK